MLKIEKLQWDNREIGETPFRQGQLIGLKLLRVLDAICKENNLTYMIFFGSLLGAVRHGGFIPWDDDIDVWMPLDDYYKFQKVAPQFLPEDVYLQTRRTDANFKKNSIKLRDAYSTVLENDTDFNNGFHCGVSLDIFPFMPYFSRAKMLEFIQRITMISAHHVRYDGCRKWLFVPIYLTMRLFWFLTRRMLPCKYFGEIPESGGEMRYARFDITDILPTKPIVFEGVKFQGPNNVEKVLTVRYGDYMRLPPQGQRIPHAHTIRPFTKCNHPHALAWPQIGDKSN